MAIITYICTLFQAVFAKANVSTSSIGRPRMTDRCRIIQKIIKWNGPAINIRNMSKDIRHMTTENVKGTIYGVCSIAEHGMVYMYGINVAYKCKV